MKKKLLVLITFISIFFLTLSGAYAKTPKTYDRNTLNNLGVNKKWKITDNNKKNVLATYKVDASEKIYDFSDILTDDEEKKLSKQIEEFIKKTGFDMVIFIDNKSYSRDDENTTYATDFYDYNDFGMSSTHYDGVMIFRNTYEADKYFDAFSFGEAQLYIPSRELSATLDDIYNEISSSHYYEGFSKYIADMTKYYENGKPSSYDKAYIDENGNIAYNTEITGSATDTQDRTTLDNLGVNKKWKITDSNRSNVLDTPKVDASFKIYDFSDILTPAEEASLKIMIDDFRDKTGFDMVIFTDDFAYTNDYANTTRATDFYDYNDFGMGTENYDGVLLFRNTYEADKYFDAFSFGKAQLYITPSELSTTLDHIYDLIKSEQYYEGFKKYIEEMTLCYDNGISDAYKDAYIDDTGHIVIPYKANYAILGFVGIIITIIVMIIMASKHKMIKKATNAADYVEEGKTNYSVKSDQFLRSRTTSYTHSSSSGSGGGGGFSGSGSSGGGFSSGGGRHG